MIDRKRIEEAALRLVGEKGYKSVRMEDLASYLGISKKTLYNHFPGKEQLIREALKRRIETNLLKLESISEQKSVDYIPRLMSVIKTAGRALRFKEGYSGDVSLPRDLVKSIFPQLRDHILTLISHLVEEGVREGYIRSDIPAETLPYIYLGIIETFVNMETRFGVKSTIEDMLKFIETIVFSGMLTIKGQNALNQGGKEIWDGE